MVALRGKKSKAQAKPKAVEKTARAKVAAKDKDGEAHTRLSQQQQLTRRREQEFLALVRFALQSNLARGEAAGQPVAGVCTAMLTALCGSGKEKALAPAQLLARLPRTERKRVCGAIFSADEVAYSCRNCQLDTTCVMCKDCFTHSDHAGHDVYFQRTTAGSSCDCGDVHAWKQSGFCSRHKGAGTKESGAKKQKLPKHIALTAPVVIDAVVEHVFQVLLGTHYGFELAEAFELFTRNLPPKFLPIQTDTDAADASESRTGSSRSTSTRAARLSEQFSVDPGARTNGPGGRLEAQVKEVKREDGTADDDASRGVLFGIRMHNDDVHALNDVINHLYVELGMSKPEARSAVSKVDNEGDATVSTKPLLLCPAVVGNLVRRSLNISVAPTWWEKQMEGVPALFEWLQFVSTTSDGLSELVSEALQKQRSPDLRGVLPVSHGLPKGKTAQEFVKERQIRLHNHALDMLEALTGGGKDLFSWASEQEASQQQRFDFRAEGVSTAVTSAGFLAEGSRVSCKNVFIEEFVKGVSLSPSYRRHESVRKSFDAIVAKYFTSEEVVASDTVPTTSSALTLLMRYDCTLRKNAVERSHAFLREHLVDVQFRASMLDAYLRSYASMTRMFLRGLGNSSESIFDFAVQFLTVPHLVQNYTKKESLAHPGRPELVRELLCALNTVFQSAVDEKRGILNADHAALSSQKYKHCVENMEYVFNIGTLSSELVCNEDNMKIWLSCLSILQGGDPQVRRGIHQNHVEYESDSWLSMFNLGIRVHSVFAISWTGFKPSQFEAPEAKVAEIFGPIIDAALSSSAHLNEKVTKKTLAPVAKLASVSKRGVGSREKTIATYDFNVASQPTSLHIPLHRFLIAALRHICISQSGLGSSIAPDGLLKVFGFDKLPADKQWELVEMPLRCLVMASQIHSNLWRRNGDENMLAQLYNYSALPYCLHYRDADTLMLQLGVLMTGPDALLARMVDRFQLGSYFLLSNGNSSAAHHDDSDDVVKKFGYSPLEQGIDEQQRLQMLEEFLRLVIIVGTSLPGTTGSTYDDEFLAEEMLQQLCAKSLPFSKLFDLAILPSGQDDIPAARLEGVLAKVSNFVPPSGLEPGRYELKDGLLESYNPYFLHLNRESHEQARDRWTTYRNARRQKAKKDTPDAPPKEPLKAAKPPVDFLSPVQAILTCESTMTIVQVILWKVVSSAHPGAASTPGSEHSVSDAVISTCLHLLVHGVHTASRSSDRRFWTRLSKTNAATSKLSVLNLLSQLLEQATTLLDSEQTGTVEWLIWKMTTESPVCRKVFEQLASDAKAKHKKLEASPSASNGSAQGGNSPPMTLEQRKMEARKRAMAAMAKRQAAFQAMVDLADEGKEEKMGDSTEDASGHAAQSSLGKRKASEVEESDEVTAERHEAENERCYNCILCHDSSAQGQMGMAAYVHQSTVLAPGFRPEPKEALGADGKKVRSHVKTVIEKMELCSGGSSTPSDMANSPSPTLRAFATTFPEWYMDGSLDDQLTRDNTAQNSPRPPAARRPRNDRIRFGNGNIPMLEGELLQTDEELEVLEGVLDLREDQQLFPMDMRGAVSLDLRGDRVEPRRLGGREVPAAQRGNPRGVMYDSDDDDGYEDVSSRFGLERMPPGFGRSHESAKLYLTPCSLHIRTCQHAVHIHCLERYITSLHDKAMRGEEFDGVQAIDPDSAMTQFLCPLCKTLSNFLIPTSEPRLAIAKEDERKHKRARAAGDEEEKTPTWNAIVEEQQRMPGWYRSVLGRDGGFEDEENETEHDLWRDYFEETLWEPHGSLEKGAPFLWSACAFTLASFLTVAEDEYRTISGSDTPFDPLTDHCPPSLEKEMESLTAVTKFCRWTFSLLEHSADAKVIWETAKRCCPINTETKREYRKFTKVLGSIDACLRGTILGLLVADTFTAFVVASVIADELETIWRSIPVFTAADLLQRLHAEFFEPNKVEGASLFQDKFSVVEASGAEAAAQTATTEASALALAPRRTRSGRPISPAASVQRPSVTAAGSVQQLLESMAASGEEDSEAYAALQVLKRMAKDCPSEKLKPFTTVSDVQARLNRILPPNAAFVRRMKLFWRCLTDEDASTTANARTMQIPTLIDIARSSDATFDQIWSWCMDRMLSKTRLGSSKVGDKCEHTEGCSEAYVASMFILREVPTRPRLIELPLQFDELYSEMAGRKCTRCEKAPCDPGLCLICGEFLCCGDSCCTRAFMPHGPPVGECTRHAAECGGGVGIVLLLEQCRIAVVGGSMAAYFPSPYVDSHGEEDIGLQRGRPLRLDMARYRYLESLWLSHRIFTEVSRQRNQRDPQYTINLSYL